MKRMMVMMLILCIALFPVTSMAASFRDGDVIMKVPDGYFSSEDPYDDIYGGEGDFFITEGSSEKYDYSLVYHVNTEERFSDLFTPSNEGDFLDDEGLVIVNRILDSYYDFDSNEVDVIISKDGTLIRLRFLREDGSDIYAYVRAINKHAFAILYAGNLKNLPDREAVTEKAGKDFESMIMSLDDKGFADYAIMLCKENADHSFDWDAIDVVEIVGFLATIILSAVISLISSKKKRFSGDSDSGMVRRIDEDLIADERISEKKESGEKKEEPVRFSSNMDQDRLKRMLDEGLITKKEYREMKRKSK